MDEAAAKANPFFAGRVAHGYFVVSAAAGLFVDPDPGPCLANYGLERLRFTRPVYPGDTLRVALTSADPSLGWQEARDLPIVLGNLLHVLAVRHLAPREADPRRSGQVTSGRRAGDRRVTPRRRHHQVGGQEGTARPLRFVEVSPTRLASMAWTSTTCSTPEARPVIV